MEGRKQIKGERRHGEVQEKGTVSDKERDAKERGEEGKKSEKVNNRQALELGKQRRERESKERERCQRHRTPGSMRTG